MRTTILLLALAAPACALDLSGLGPPGSDATDGAAPNIAAPPLALFPPPPPLDAGRKHDSGHPMTTPSHVAIPDEAGIDTGADDAGADDASAMSKVDPSCAFFFLPCSTRIQDGGSGD